jgi:hypothetical protein
LSLEVAEHLAFRTWQAEVTAEREPSDFWLQSPSGIRVTTEQYISLAGALFLNVL